MAVLFWLFLAVVILSPLPKGSVHMWSWATYGACLSVFIITWSIIEQFHNHRTVFNVYHILGPTCLFVGVLLWAAVQVLPISPVDWHHPIWVDATNAVGTEITSTISINKFAGASGIVRLLLYAGVFWLAFQFGRDPQRARQVFSALAITGGIYAAYGISVEISGSATILWMKKTSYFDVLTSTFVNRNSYATFAGLGLIATTACLVRISENINFGDAAPRIWVVEFINILLGKNWYIVSCWLLIFVALLLTGSRGGFLSTFLGMIVFIIIINSRKNVPGGNRLGLILSIGFATLTLLVISGALLLERLAGTTIESDLRPEIYRLTVDAIADRPWTGFGLGTFEDVFRIYRSDKISATVAKAHNTYLEIALELGIPAATALVSTLIWLTGICFKGVFKRRREAVWSCGGLAASVIVGTHSLIDFSLQIPAVSMTYALILGVACAQSWSTRES